MTVSPAPTQPVKAYPDTWMNITSLVTSILGLAIVGIIFGHMGMARANRGTAELKGLGLAGAIIGYIVLAFYLVFFWLLAVSWGEWG